MTLGLPQSSVPPNPRGGFLKNWFLPHGSRTAEFRLIQLCLEPRVLSRIEDEEQHPRLCHVPRHRVRGRILARLKRFARVVIQRHHATQSSRLGMIRMRLLRLHAEKKRPGIADDLIAKRNRVVQIPLLFRLADQISERDQFAVSRS